MFDLETPQIIIFLSIVLSVVFLLNKFLTQLLIKLDLMYLLITRHAFL
jgi:hypothetical protein